MPTDTARPGVNPISGLTDLLGRMVPSSLPRLIVPGRARRVLSVATRLSLVSANVVGAVALAGMLLTEKIDDDLDYVVSNPVEGGLASVDMVRALIEREVTENAWVPNEPGFMPGAWLRNMQAYQEGMIYGLSRFAFELADSLGRVRGSTAVDPDLDRAAGLLRFPGNVWLFDFEKTWTPVVTSEEQYQSAARALEAYNLRVASGEAVFDARPDNLYAALERIESDISSKANVLVDHVERIATGVRVDQSSNFVFFNTKGRVYAYAMVIEELGKDFEDVIQREGLGLLWSRMTQSLRNAASLHPVFVTDSKPGSMFLPSHVAELGFFALRAKTQLRYVMSALRGG